MLKHQKLFFLLLGVMIGLALAVFWILPLQAGAQGLKTMTQAPDTTFTYQGRLLKDGSYVNGVTCNFQFGLYDNASGGTPLGAGIQSLASLVSDGYFTVDLNFGIIITGTFYLETAVQCPGDVAFNTLAPRVTLHPAPYAAYAQSVSWGGITDVPANIGPYTPGYGLNLAGNQFSVVTSTIQQRVGGSCATGNSIRVVNADGTVTCEADDNTTYTAGNGLVLAGTQFSAAFAGTGSANTVARSDHNHDATYINAGEAAGGDLTGTYPNPDIANNAVGMAEINETMGSGEAGDIASTAVGNASNYLWPTTTVFTPTANGHCMVTVNVNVASSGTNNGGGAWIRTAKSMAGGNSYGSYRSYMSASRSANHLGSTTVADIMSVTGGQQTQFGCYLYANDTSWTDDEFWHCEVAYICQ